jgi:hypothetical protein
MRALALLGLLLGAGCTEIPGADQYTYATADAGPRVASVQQLTLEAFATGGVTTATLSSSVSYRLTVVGTFSWWPATTWATGHCMGVTPDPAPEFLSAGRENGPVGYDAAFRYALPAASPSCCGWSGHPEPWDGLKMRVPGQPEMPLGAPLPPATFDPTGHRYAYALMGAGLPLIVRVSEVAETDYSDNYGALELTLEPMP